MLGNVFAWLLAAGMALLGGVACAWPVPTSRLYGVPQEGLPGTAWVRAAGLRDLGLALALAVFLWEGSLHAAAVVSLATAAIAAGDFASVLALRGRAAILPLAVHASGIAMGVASGALLTVGAP